jgi:uncharacterized protein YndB with AHSA1/START domain
MNKSIHHRYFFPQAPNVVWKYLTEASLIEQWLMPNNFEPIVGHEFQFRSKPAPLIEFDGIAYCKVLEIVPMKKLTYSWKCGPGENKITLDSIVVWTLTPRDGGTELVLEQTGFKELENANIFLAMKEGWAKHVKMIEELINTETHA